MNVKISYCPKPAGTITPVSSKSISNRALIIDALTGFKCRLNHLSASDDTQILQRLLQQFRAGENTITLDAGMAGTVMRFMATFCCLSDREVLLTGSERMQQRPMKELVDALKQLGAGIEYAGKEGFAPLRIRPSKIAGGKLSIPAGISSQFISSLLLCAPYFEHGLELELTGEPVSYSYILLTAQVMKHFGAQININGNFIEVLAQPYRPAEYTIEGDWSSASYFYSLAALSEQCEIVLKGLNPRSLQGDRAIVEMTSVFGVETQLFGNDLILRRKEVRLPSSVQEDFLLCPDIAQTMAVICAGQKIPHVVLSGLSTLSGKETDRTQALQKELAPFGVSFSSSDKGQLIFDASGFSVSSQAVKTYYDHRMAMSFAPLAQKTGTLVIEDAQVVQKSYPGYWNDLKMLGCLVENSDI